VKVVKVWWEWIIAAVVVVVVIYSFLLLTGFETRLLSRKTSRTAESMYGDHADSARKQRRYARNCGGQWHEGEDTKKS
jgi:hypothetical protein